MSELNISPISPRSDDTTKKHHDKLPDKSPDKLPPSLVKYHIRTDDEGEPSSNKKPSWRSEGNRWVRIQEPSPSMPSPPIDPNFILSQQPQPLPSSPHPAVIFHPPSPSFRTSSTQPDKLRTKFPPSGKLQVLPENISESVQELANTMNEEGRLKTVIKKRNNDIHKKMINFEKKLEQHEPQNKHTREQIIAISQDGELTGAGGGGGAYKLKDKNGIPRFVIKPNDQDSRCLNNAKNLANPFIENDETNLDLNEIRNRPDIPLYESVQNEALAYDLACVTGLEEITPRTIAVTLENREFYCMTNQFDDNLQRELQNKVTNPKKKLCSAQEYINGIELGDLEKTIKTEKEKNKNVDVLYEIDKDDYEMANIFTWLTGKSR